MSATLSAVILDALALPPRDRAGLVGFLLESLEESALEDESLMAELTRRAAEMRSGAVRGLTTEEAYGFSL